MAGGDHRRCRYWDAPEEARPAPFQPTLEGIESSTQTALREASPDRRCWTPSLTDPSLPTASLSSQRAVWRAFTASCLLKQPGMGTKWRPCLVTWGPPPPWSSPVSAAPAPATSD